MPVFPEIKILRGRSRKYKAFICQARFWLLSLGHFFCLSTFFSPLSLANGWTLEPPKEGEKRKYHEKTRAWRTFFWFLIELLADKKGDVFNEINLEVLGGKRPSSPRVTLPLLCPSYLVDLALAWNMGCFKFISLLLCHFCFFPKKWDGRTLQNVSWRTSDLAC